MIINAYSGATGTKTLFFSLDEHWIPLSYEKLVAARVSYLVRNQIRAHLDDKEEKYVLHQFDGAVLLLVQHAGDRIHVF